jgi:hypothetical protein
MRSDGTMAYPLYAWATLLEDGRPSLVGTYNPELRAHLPLVGFSEESICGIGTFARSAARAHLETTGQRVFLMRFESVSVLEELLA